MTSTPTEQRLAAEPASVRVARRTVHDALAHHRGMDEATLQGALLATSEVVTNAIEHGAPPIDLRVLDGGATARVEVRDASPLLPRLGHEAAPTDIRGRGMSIVAALVSRWGVQPLGEGKAVWFEIDL